MTHRSLARMLVPALALALVATPALAQERGQWGGQSMEPSAEQAAGHGRAPAGASAEVERDMRAAGRMIARFDADGDGRLDAGELARALAALGNRPGRADDRVDDRADARPEGRDQRARWLAERAGPAGRRGQGPWQGPDAFDRIDTDGDGVISRAEWQAARAAAGKARRDADGAPGARRGRADVPSSDRPSGARTD